jgi:hypothetical protein
MLAVPNSMAKRPLTKHGLPIPFVAAWSSERWASARIDPLALNKWAIFGAGRQGRGRPLLGVMNEERQRRVSMLNLCQICAEPYGNDGWIALVAPREVNTQTGEKRITTFEPPACGDCMEWAVAHCPGLKKDREVKVEDAIYPARSFDKVLELIDPSAGPPVYNHLFDGQDNPEVRDRLGRVARKHGGLVGYVEFAVPYGCELAQR